jgi:hypothetical protein
MLSSRRSVFLSISSRYQTSMRATLVLRDALLVKLIDAKGASMSARESDLLRLQAIVDCIDDARETIGAFDLGIDNYVTPDGILDNTYRRSTDMLMV